MTHALKAAVRLLARDVGLNLGLGQALLAVLMGFFAIALLGLAYVAWLQAATLVDYLGVAVAIAIAICALIATVALATAWTDDYGALGVWVFIFVCTSLALVLDKQWIAVGGLLLLAFLIGLVHTWWRDGGGYEWAHRSGGAR